jgi:copper transport protein
LTLVFSESVTSRLSSVKVIGPAGRQVGTGAPRTTGPDGDSIVVDLAPEPEPGTFVLDWRATAADDGHATSGTLTFSVGTPSRTAVADRSGPTGGSDRITDAVLDLSIWTGFAGLALMVGLAAIRLYCLPTDATRRETGTAPEPSPGSRAAALRRPATLGWSALLAGTLLQLFVYGPSTQGESLSHVLDRGLLAATLSTHEGHALVGRLLLLALVAAIGEPVLRRRGGTAAAAVLTLALAATWSGISHASTGSLVPLALAVTTVHVTAMAVWAGGLFTVAVLLTRDGDTDLPTTVARFSRLALASVTLLAATGLYQAFREVDGWSALGGTEYGRLLLLKTAVLSLVLAAAGVTRVRTARSPEPGDAGLRRSVLLELAGVTVLLAVTVALVGSAPATRL